MAHVEALRHRESVDKLSDLDNVGDEGSAMRALASSLLANAETRVIYPAGIRPGRHNRAALGLTSTEQKVLPELSTGQGFWRIKTAPL